MKCYWISIAHATADPGAIISWMDIFISMVLHIVWIFFLPGFIVSQSNNFVYKARIYYLLPICVGDDKRDMDELETVGMEVLNC